jgi:hypothetical protein
MSDTKELIREAQVEEAKWRFFSVFRLQLQDCLANERMLEEELEHRTLPITFENLSWVWENLSPEKRANYAASTSSNVVKQRQTQAPDPAVEAAKAAEAAAAAQTPEGVLPAEWTALRIKKAARDEYGALIKKYGSAAINDRLAGRS